MFRRLTRHFAAGLVDNDLIADSQDLHASIAGILAAGLVGSGCVALMFLGKYNSIVASVPLLPKRHISIGKRLQISSASSHSMSCGMPYIVPVESRFSTAFITAGWQCPAISAPNVRL